jgi:UDP-N-acetylmuramoyl-L-alanyl-D-glutamate--2,6-diaminopimelate ligase
VIGFASTCARTEECSRKGHPNKCLHDVLKGIRTLEVCGDLGVRIHGLSCDSRTLQPGDLFIALPGEHSDGHNYVAHAAERGAVAALVERSPFTQERAGKSFTIVRVSDTLRAMGKVAAALYDFPGHSLTFVGITGSNGKTTVAYLTEGILRRAGYKVGAITTVKDWWPGTERTARFTTPRSDELQALLWEMRRDGVTHVVSEVSSHALVQHRMSEVTAEAAVFTNLSLEHRELHPTEEDYYRAKRRLFTEVLRPAGLACINVDDSAGKQLSKELKDARLLTYGISQEASVQATEPHFSMRGTSFELILPGEQFQIHTGLLGNHNVSNLLAAIAVTWGMGIPASAIADAARDLAAPPGRLERIDEGQDFWVFVDYGHSPDALEKSLASLRMFAPGKIITVMGCGGERSAEKRAPMGRIAAENSDFVVLTSDNSRGEKAADIIRQIEEGIVNHETGYLVEEDRAKAILEAIRRAGPSDIVLLAGKGHETGQTEQGQTRPFDDRIESRRALRSLLHECE